MTITFRDGTRLQAAFSMRSPDTLRVAVPGQIATCKFTRMSGAWISADGGPATIEFQPEKPASGAPSVDESNRSEALASRLITRLLDPSDGDLLQDMLSYLP